PDALAAPVLVEGAFELVGGGRGPPDEVGGECVVLRGRHGVPLGSVGGRGGDVAAGGLAGARLDEAGGDLPADGDGDRAARDEAAALGRVDGGRRAAVPLLDALAVDGGEQQARVRVERLREHALDGAA